MNEICQKCGRDCKFYCEAIHTLAEINRQQKKNGKTALVRKLARQLGIRDAEPSKKLEKLGKAIIDRFPEFGFIKEYDIRIGYVISYEKKGGAKIVYADCRKLQEPLKAYLPFDFIITFYDDNTSMLNKKQMKILMYHELRHIGVGDKGLKIEPHTIEDFKDILEKYGLSWNEYGQEVPDILAGD